MNSKIFGNKVKWMKIAIIGLGVIGRVHEKVLKMQGFDVVALCDEDMEKLKDFEGVEKYTDYIKMLDEVKPDAVHICTPHHLHADMVVEALSRDINVLCEKPLCIKEEDIDRILEAEEKSKAILGVSHQNRYNKENVFIKEYLRDKKDVDAYASVVWRRDADYYGQDEWRGKKATEGGGVLINQALHTLDMLIWLTGMPEFVTASVSNLALKNVIDVEDTATLICSGGANFSLHATNSSNISFPVSIKVIADHELIESKQGSVTIGDKTYEFKHDGHVNGKPCYGTGHEELFVDFYDCIKTGRKFMLDGKEASKVIKVILATYKSGGEKIKI